MSKPELSLELLNDGLIGPYVRETPEQQSARLLFSATYAALSQPKRHAADEAVMAIVRRETRRRDQEDRAIVDGEEDRDEEIERYEERCNE